MRNGSSYTEIRTLPWILAPQRSRFTHYYFYIRDETLDFATKHWISRRNTGFRDETLDFATKHWARW